MAGRPKNTTKKYTNSNKYSESPVKTNADYKFDIHTKVLYKGALHDNCKNKIGIITKRSNKNNRIDYSVLFENGTEINCILEKVLEKVDDSQPNNIIESEEAHET